MTTEELQAELDATLKANELWMLKYAELQTELVDALRDVSSRVRLQEGSSGCPESSEVAG